MSYKLELAKGGTELVIRIPVRRILVRPSKKKGTLDLGGFTQRERQVLTGLLAGKVAKEMATELNLSERTIKFHLSMIYTKTGLRRTDLHRQFGTVQ